MIILDHLLDHESLADVIDRLDDPHPAVVAHALHALACDRCKQGSCRPGESHFVAKAIELLDVHPSTAVRSATVDALRFPSSLLPDVRALSDEASHSGGRS